MADRIVKRITPTLVLAALAAGTPAIAYQAQLSDAAVRDARASGQEQAATRGQGYVVQDYVLWDRDEPLHISPDTPLIDAVIVSTPRERVLYEAYFRAFQDKDWSEEEAIAFADETNETLGFRIFAHAPSGGPEDRDFLDRFGEARLSFGDGRTLTSSVDDTSAPATDFYITEDGRHVFRWLGTVSYRFDLSDLSAQDVSELTGTLEFSDSEGNTHFYDVDLSAYE
jgi:hypothetical protein